MYSKKLRLPLDNRNFTPARITSSHCFYVNSKISSGDHNRYAIIIPAKIIKKSSDRHFFKRIIADHLRQWPNMERDFVLVATAQMKNSSKKEMTDELDSVLEKIRIKTGEQTTAK